MEVAKIVLEGGPEAVNNPACRSRRNRLMVRYQLVLAAKSPDWADMAAYRLLATRSYDSAPKHADVTQMESCPYKGIVRSHLRLANVAQGVVCSRL